MFCANLPPIGGKLRRQLGIIPDRGKLLRTAARPPELTPIPLLRVPPEDRGAKLEPAPQSHICGVPAPSESHGVIYGPRRAGIIVLPDSYFIVLAGPASLCSILLKSEPSPG